MVQIGILLIILGFGSLILETMNMEFRILSWADDMQPALGIVVGIIGVVLVVLGVLQMKKKEANQTGQQTGVGQWAGNGQWAGSSPSAPQTTGPLTGDPARGNLQYDVEPTGLGGGQSGRPDQMGGTGQPAGGHLSPQGPPPQGPPTQGPPPQGPPPQGRPPQGPPPTRPGEPQEGPGFVQR